MRPWPRTGEHRRNDSVGTALTRTRDRSLTLEQNYKRLGLSTKLNAAVNAPRQRKGTGRLVEDDARQDSLAITPVAGDSRRLAREVAVERDPETGHIIRVIDEDAEATENPLNDPLNELSEAEDEDVGKEDTRRKEGNIVAQLESQAVLEAESLKKKRPRQQSEREQEWMAKLAEKHGENTAAMFRDKKLNPMQQSEGDIKRRLKKWKQKNG